MTTNPYINVIKSQRSVVKLYCPYEGRRLMWDGFKQCYECPDCSYVPPPPGQQQQRQQQQPGSSRIVTRDGKTATVSGKRSATSSSMQTRAIGGWGSRILQHERPLDPDEQVLAEQQPGVTFTNRDEFVEAKGVFDPDKAADFNRKRLEYLKKKNRR